MTEADDLITVGCGDANGMSVDSGATENLVDVLEADQEVTEPLTIALSNAQVKAIVEKATGTGAMRDVLFRHPDNDSIRSVEFRQLEDPRLSRSLLRGLLMLAAFPAYGDSVGILELAGTLDMNSSTAHRYVSTFVAAGLVERDSVTRRYRLAQ